MTMLDTSSQSSLGMPLLAAPLWLGRPAVFGLHRVWTWRDIHTASLDVASQLDRGTTVFNLCSSRVAFLIVWLAALRCRCKQLLPPSGGSTELSALLEANRDGTVVTDDASQNSFGAAQRVLRVVPCARTGGDDADLGWRPTGNEPLVRLYTSGSTGIPQPQDKTLDQLTCGAELLARRLDSEVAGGFASITRIVCSVPPQHMFGLEASVMLSLRCGVPVVDRRPLLPADTQEVIDSGSDGVLWVATPTHLRAQVRTGLAPKRCRAVLSSTMPLPTALAEQSEALLQAPVLEIYGSTETGALAMRRPARAATWCPLDGVTLESSDAGVLARGNHFSSPQWLPDVIERDDDNGFRLVGRVGDLIKIAGRRASLAGLNLLLQDLPGLQDGVFYQPKDSEVGRLALIYTGPPLDVAAAGAWLSARIDPVFVPRAFIRVDQLPRSDAGKLPQAALDAIYRRWRTGKAHDGVVRL